MNAGVSPRGTEPRKVAYLAVDHLMVETARLADPALASRKIVVGGEPHERKHVLDACAECYRLGVRRGMTLRQCHQLVPDAAFLPPDAAAYRRVREALLDILEEFSPLVEAVGQDGAYLDVSGSRLLFGEDPVLAEKVVRAVRERLGLKARLGLGSGKFVARLAARRATERPVIVAPEDTRAFLSRQPARLLPLPKNGAERLRWLGIETFAQFARLPVADLTIHFGGDGPRTHRLVRGIDPDPVRARMKEKEFRAGQELDPPVADLTQLRPAAERMISRLAMRLGHEGRGCRTLTIEAEMESGRLLQRQTRIEEATDDPNRLLRAFDGLASEWNEGISRLEIVLGDLSAPPAGQMPLFDAQREQLDRLTSAVARIRSQFGDRAKRIVPWEEDSYIPSRRFHLEDY